MMTSEITRRDIPLEGLSYPVLEAGSGPLVVCLHGFPDNYETFLGQMPSIAEAGYRVVSPMLPGYSPKSQREGGRHDPVYVRDRLIALIEVLLAEQPDEQPGDKAYLLGHDWGGIMGYLIAEQRPDLLHSLMAMTVPYNVSLPRVFLRAPGYTINAFYLIFFQLPWLPEWALRRSNFRMIEWLIELWSPQLSGRLEVLASIKDTFTQPGVLAAALDYYRNSFFSLNRASRQMRRSYRGQIQVPTLAIRGSEDFCLPEKIWQVMSPASFPQGLKLERVTGAGHFMQIEKPQWVAERMIRWIQDTA